MYLFSCKICCNQYIASDLSFQLRFYNNISVHRSFIKAGFVNKALFQAHSGDEVHHGMSDWEITFNKLASSVDDLKSESFGCKNLTPR